MNYTPKQLQILRLIHDYQIKHGYSPTYAELAKDLHVSTITVFEHLQALERKGAIRRRRHEARSVEIVEPNFLRETATRKAISLRGSFTPGKALALSETGEEVPLGEYFALTAAAYAVRVKGDELKDEMIADGDVLVFEERTNPVDGEWVLAEFTDGNSALKRVRLEEGKAMLKGGGTAVAVEQARIKGVLKGVIRRM
jgi:repressor LexA